MDTANAINGRTPPVERRGNDVRSEEHTSELQSLRHLVCRLLLEKKKQTSNIDLYKDDIPFLSIHPLPYIDVDDNNTFVSGKTIIQKHCTHKTAANSIHGQ